MADPSSLTSVEAAVAHLREGGLVAFPTETSWGLAAHARDAAAVARLRAWKGRDPKQPISVLVESAAALAGLGVTLSPSGQRLAEAFWPGPLTLVAPTTAGFAEGVAREDGGLGLRCSPHPVAAALLKAAAAAGLGPLTATSLNRGGEPAARSRAEAAALCGAGPEAPRLLDLPGPDAGGGEASSVVDLCGPEPVLLRAGAQPWEDIAAVLAERRSA